MSWPAYAEPWRLKAAILERVGAGETIAAVCAAPAMPTPATVSLWARTDPDFRAGLALAKTRGAHRRRWSFHEAAAQALLARLRAGEPITAILREPAMPSRRVYRHWRATQAHFQEEVARLNGLKAEEKGHSRRRRWRPFDPALADRLLVRVSRGEPLKRALVADPELPSRAVLRRWREQDAPWDRALRTAIRVGQRVRGRAACRCTPALTAKIAARLRDGATLARLGRSRGYPCATTLYAWVRARPDFAAAIARAARDRSDAAADQVLAIAEAATPQTLADDRRRIAALRRQADRLSARAERTGRR